MPQLQGGGHCCPRCCHRRTWPRCTWRLRRSRFQQPVHQLSYCKLFVYLTWCKCWKRSSQHRQLYPISKLSRQLEVSRVFIYYVLWYYNTNGLLSVVVAQLIVSC
jgi:hypothetical protein